MKHVYLFLLLLLTSTGLFSQPITVVSTAATGRFNTCPGNNIPVVSVNYLNGTGSSVVGGSIACNDPCGTTTIRVTMSNLEWDQFPDAEWLHGLFLPNNAGYTVSGINLPAGFMTYNNGCTGQCPVGTTAGPGFYFDATGANSCCGLVLANDAMPCNNYGSVALDCGISFGIQFDLTFCNSNLTALTETFVLTGTSDGATGCWSFNNNALHTVSFTINTVPCAPVLNVPLQAAAPVRTCVGNQVNYSAVLTGGCGSGSTVSWWDSPTGGTQVGAGSPFVYDPAGSACPAGTTLYASCCPGGNASCVGRTPVTIPGNCDVLAITSVTTANGTCLVPGSISAVQVAGAVAPVSYTLNPGNVTNTTGVFTGLTGNTYTVTATDGTGCSVSSIVNLVQPPFLNLQVSVLDPLCFNAGNGSLTFIATGGVGGMSYTVNGVSQLSPFAAPPGTYTVVATDGNNCSASSVVSVLNPPALTLIASPTAPLCNGGIGSIAFSATGGTGTIAYAVNGVLQVSPFQIGAGTYTITASDVNGCTSSTVVSLIDPPALNLSVIPSNPPCVGNGSLAFSASGGMAPFAFAVNGVLQVSPFSAPAGTYTIVVTDANLCTASSVAVLTANPGLVLSASATNPSCNGGNGILTFSATGGIGAISYLVNGLAQASPYAGPAGTYTLVASDAGNCTASTLLTIVEPPAIQLNTSVIPPSCAGGNGLLTWTTGGGSGIITVTVNGILQSSPYTAPPGTYTLVATDANACTLSTALSVVNPAAIALSASATLPLCFGGTGTITFNATGGTAPLSFLVNGTPQTSPYAAAAGTYTILVTDANACTSSTVFTLNQPPAVQITQIIAVSPSCVPGNDGSLNITAAGGTPALQFSVNGGPLQASNLINGLGPGSYTVMVADANGCTATSVHAIAAPMVPAVTMVGFTDVLCNGGSDGNVTLSGTGGTAPLSYTLQPGAVSNATGFFPNLGANNYTVTVTDALGCTAQTVVAVSEPPAVQWITLQSTGVTCSGGSDGSITAFAGGGTGALNYSLQPTNQNNTTGTFNNLGANTYTVTATDANGCTLSNVVVLAQPQGLVFTVAQASMITCFGAANGQIIVAASGGSGALQYTLFPGAVVNATGNFSALAAGIYTVTVSDANACTLTTTLTITEPAQIAITSLAIQHITCHNLNNGAVSVQASGGTGALTYVMNPGFMAGPGGVFSNLAGATYTVIVSDANGCTGSILANVIDPPALTLTLTTLSNLLCFGDSNAAAQLQAAGGTGNGFSYVLSPMGQTSTTGYFSGLPAGSFTVTASDINNCTVSVTMSIAQPAQIIPSIDSVHNISCHNANDGHIGLSVTGGLSPYVFTLYPGNSQNGTGIFSNLSSGIYTVAVLDALGCQTGVSPILINNPTAITWLQVQKQDALCYGDSSGVISVAAGGGTGSLNYSLQPALGLQTQPGQFSALPAGVYTIIVTDANNCSVSTLVNVLQSPPLLISTVSYQEPGCWGDGDGRIAVTAAGGVGPLTYQLNGNGSQGNGLFNNLLAGTYSIVVRDSLQCAVDTLVQLEQPGRIYFSKLDIQGVRCVGASDGKIQVTGNGGRGKLTYYLRPGLHISSSGTFDGLFDGFYTLTIRDSLGCHFDTTLLISLPLNPFYISTNKHDLTCFGRGEEGWAEVLTQGGEAPYTFLWSTIPPQVTRRVDGLRFGYYFVEAYDRYGCLARDTVYIDPGPCCEQVFIPNAFSPNGDGVNDVFRVGSSAAIELQQFEVYNRWGQRVWSTNDYFSAWDGTYLGAPQPMETYFYVFRYTCLTDGNRYVKKGDLVLMR
jgi:gliding motility-associated-like protein